MKIDREMEKCLFVDPGIEGTGWAFFPKLRVNTEVPLPPTGFGVLRYKQNVKSWEARVSEICSSFTSLVEVWVPTNLFLEFPGLWTTGVSMASATSGDLFKLTYLIGGFGEISRQRIPNLPILFSPQAWKGQLPKQVVTARIERCWKHLGNVPNHAGDAIGMGLAAQGAL